MKETSNLSKKQLTREETLVTSLTSAIKKFMVMPPNELVKWKWEVEAYSTVVDHLLTVDYSDDTYVKLVSIDAYLQNACFEIAKYMEEELEFIICMLHCNDEELPF